MDSGVCSAINYVWNVGHTVLSLLISFSICKGQFRIALFLFIFFHCFSLLFISFYFLFNYLKIFYSTVLVSAIQQCNSAVMIHTFTPSLASLPSPLPISPGHHRAPDWAPCVTQQLLTNIPLTPDSSHMLMLPSPLGPLSASPTVHKSII